MHITILLAKLRTLDKIGLSLVKLLLHAQVTSSIAEPKAEEAAEPNAQQLQ